MRVFTHQANVTPLWDALDSIASFANEKKYTIFVKHFSGFSSLSSGYSSRNEVMSTFAVLAVVPNCVTPYSFKVFITCLVTACCSRLLEYPSIVLSTDLISGLKAQALIRHFSTSEIMDSRLDGNTTTGAEAVRRGANI